MREGEREGEREKEREKERAKERSESLIQRNRIYRGGCQPEE